MDKLCNQYINKIQYCLLIAFVAIQPILDIHYLYTERVINILGFSPATIIRLTIVSILTLLTILNSKSKRVFKLVGIYLFFIFIYTIFHIIHTKNFYTLSPDNLGYSIIGEIFYIVRMLMPIAIIIITINTKISRKDYEKAIKIILFTISITIVITNIFKLSFESYGIGIIKYNIFNWFTNGYVINKYSDYASRGLFNSANQISALLILLLPIMLVIYTYQSTIKNLILIVITLISMIMLGTKVALYGSFISIVVYLLSLVLIWIVKKERLFTKEVFLGTGVSLFVITSLYFVSPAVNRPSLEQNYGNKKESVDIALLKSYQKDNERDKMVEFIKDNYKLAKIKDEFIVNSYNYKYDPDFWVEVFEMPLIKRRDWRLLELKMHQRVMDINNNKNDKLLGIGFTRSEHLFTLERDFIAQYYSMGILGVILFLVPYIIFIFACFIKALVKFNKKFNLINLITGFTIIFILVSSISSGNVMDCLTINIILAFIVGKLTKDIFV